jgi:hypothetical protein
MRDGFTKEEMDNIVAGVTETYWTEMKPEVTAGKIIDKFGIEKYFFTWEDVGTIFLSPLTPGRYYISKFEGKREGGVRLAFGSFVDKYTSRYRKENK